MSSHASTVDEPGAPPHVHHMDTTTAYEAAKFGMWLFLATEVLLFGGLFAAYAFYHWLYYDFFHHASTHLNWVLGFTNTLVLLVSSLFAALAVDAAQHGKNKEVSTWLISTIVCGCIFLVIKYFEYSNKIGHGLFPHFSLSQVGIGISSQEYKAYFGLYYCMTGLHALHVILGMGLIIWALRKSLKDRFSPRYYTPVEVSALYWHLVDLIWIFLFPLLYLVG